MIVEDFLILFLGGFSFHLMGLQYSHSFIHLNIAKGTTDPRVRVLLTKVTSLSYITSSYTNLEQKSSESQPSTNFKISTKHQHFDRT